MVSSEDLDSRRCTNSAVSEEVWNSLKVSTSAAAIVEMDGSRRHCRDVICSLVDRTPAVASRKLEFESRRILLLSKFMDVRQRWRVGAGCNPVAFKA